MRNKKDSKSNNAFSPEKAYQELLRVYSEIEQEKEKAENTILQEKVDKLVQGKSVVLGNYSIR